MVYQFFVYVEEFQNFFKISLLISIPFIHSFFIKIERISNCK